MPRGRLSDDATRIAEDILAGKIVSGQFVRMAAQRHIDDRESGHKRGLDYRPADARHVIEFFPSCLTITEGEKQGEPFELLDWHKFVVGQMYGWKDINGLRRFRIVWLETGKGQAKSPVMGAVGIYTAGFAGLRRSEVYCIGEDKGTARVVFRDAVSMVRAPIPGRDGDTMENIGHFTVRGTGDNAYKIEQRASESFMLPMANTDAVSGPKPSAVLGDEIHEMKRNRAVEIWRAAITKKAGDPFMMLGTNTPSVDQVVGTDYSEYFQGVVRGDYKDDAALVYIARVDPDDDPFNDESCWAKSMPALGVTFPIENVRKVVEQARNQASTRLAVERLYFGIPVGSSGFWTDEKAWSSALGTVELDDMVGRKLHLSLDLSQKNDLSSLSGCWEGPTLHVKTWYWTRASELDRRTAQDRIPYRELEREGCITILDRTVIDYRFIAEQVKALNERYGVEQLVVDSAFIQDFIAACEEVGLPVWMYEGEDGDTGTGIRIVRHAQGKRVVFQNKMLCMPKSIERLEDRILDGTVVVDDNRLTTICAANAVVDVDAQLNRAFDKARSRGRIDGMVTTAMAVGAASAEMETRSSVYETRGLRVL